MLYLPGLDVFFQIYIRVLLAFKIRRVNTTHLKGFNYAVYLLCPKLVQFHVTLRNLI